MEHLDRWERQKGAWVSVGTGGGEGGEERGAGGGGVSM